jgi:ABC-type lipoprotein release transport system permease subunit
VGRRDGERADVARAEVLVDAVERDAPFRYFPLVDMMAGIAWVFQAFSASASLLGILGLLLAFSGTYAVVAFLMTQRTREFGIRMALGSTVSGIFQLVIKEGVMLIGAGVVFGLAAARIAGDALEGQLLGVTPGDPARWFFSRMRAISASVSARIHRLSHAAM